MGSTTCTPRPQAAAAAPTSCFRRPSPPGRSSTGSLSSTTSTATPSEARRWRARPTAWTGKRCGPSPGTRETSGSRLRCTRDSGQTMLRFTYTSGASYTGDFALDDIQLGDCLLWGARSTQHRAWYLAAAATPRPGVAKSTRRDGVRRRRFGHIR